ncbi:MAG: cobalamin-dependent protein [Magnetococcales bacterium]|nr:cobalamin-dependent protein [Magnetococcales bacterium]
MKILIILPRINIHSMAAYDMPLGTLYISSALKNAGKNVHTLNLNHQEGAVEEIVAKAVNTIDPDICACGGLSVHIQTINSVFRAARGCKPDIINISGGGLVSADPEMAITHVDFDIGVIGEGEQAVVEIVSALEENTPLDKVPGLILKGKDNLPKRTLTRDVNRNIGELSWPDFAGFQEERLLEMQIPQDNYITTLNNNPRAIPIISSRSCPLSCTFCYHPNGQVYRERDLDDFCAELDHLIATYDVNIIMVLDEMLSIKKKRLVEFCKRIKPYNIQWMCQLHEKSLDQDILKLLKDSGCSYISLGIESMSEPILTSMKKYTTPQKLANALDLVYGADIGLQGNFLLGDPADTLETTAESFDYWARHPEYIINYFTIQVLPGSEIYKDAIKNGRIPDPVKAFTDPSVEYNLTTMSDELFFTLRDRIMLYIGTLLHMGKLENFGRDVTPHKVRGLGNSCQWRCQKCSGVNHYENLFTHSFGLLLTCRNCKAKSYVQIWAKPMMVNSLHPEADRQLYLAERYEEAFLQSKFVSVRNATENELQKLLEKHCLPFKSDGDPWACVRASLKYAEIKLLQKDHKTAIPFIVYALRNNTWNPDCHAAFAQALTLEGSLGAALLYFKKAIELSEDPKLSWIKQRDEIETIIAQKNLNEDKVGLYFNAFK